jgi:ribose 5-phosphate isomerase A
VKAVKSGDVVGLGSGRTVVYAITELGRKAKTGKTRICCIPSSYQALLEALKAGLKISSLYEHPEIDITLDGADEVDARLNLTKGGGGALAREKTLAAASKRYTIIVDGRKLVDKLGSSRPIPVEVLPFAAPTVKRKLEKIFGRAEFREGSGKLGPTVTDNGNFLLDVHTGPLDNPWETERRIKSIPGVVEVGLFVEMAHEVYVGFKDGVKRLSHS